MTGSKNPLRKPWTLPLSAPEEFICKVQAGCFQCEFDEAEGGLVDHCKDCQREIVTAAYELFTHRGYELVGARKGSNHELSAPLSDESLATIIDSPNFRDYEKVMAREILRLRAPQNRGSNLNKAIAEGLQPVKNPASDRSEPVGVLIAALEEVIRDEFALPKTRDIARIAILAAHGEA